MAVPPPSNFLRLKYRAAPIQPELRDGEEGKALSIARKVRSSEDDTLASELQALRFRPAIMFPGHTQNRRCETVIASDDVAYRKETKPTLFERIELEKQYARKRQREADNARRKEEQKEALRERLTQIALQVAGRASRGSGDDGEKEEEGDATGAAAAAGKRGGGDGEEDKRHDGDDDDNKHGGEGQEQQDTSAGMTTEEAALTSLSEQDLALMDEDDLADYRAAVLDLKEKRLLRLRAPRVFHHPVSAHRRRMLALKLFFGIGKREREMTEILPWLILGRVDPTRNMYSLAKLGVTHILNCTEDCPNLFPMHFVYLQLFLRDSLEANAAEYFPQALEFFRRVEKKRGKIYVHCEAGASRAPTFVIAYLMVERGVCLRDALSYVQSRRPLVQVNEHFLYQLAQLELAQGKGSSVTNHREFLFYEFNMLRADIEQERDAKGLLVSVCVFGGGGLSPNPLHI